MVSIRFRTDLHGRFIWFFAPNLAVPTPSWRLHPEIFWPKICAIFEKTIFCPTLGPKKITFPSPKNWRKIDPNFLSCHLNYFFVWKNWQKNEGRMTQKNHPVENQFLGPLSSSVCDRSDVNNGIKDARRRQDIYLIWRWSPGNDFGLTKKRATPSFIIPHNESGGATRNRGTPRICVWKNE